jgi:amidase
MSSSPLGGRDLANVQSSARNILERDTVNAFCRHTHAELQGAPHGALRGLTFAAKDIYDIAGHKTGFGSPDWLATHDAATATAPAVQRLLDAGAHLVGKTHTDELTYSLNGENAHYGTPVNVNAPGRIPGGSSSGSAAAVAAGLVDFALGSDTGGSVRAPASFCGVYGMRPTHGRVPLAGVCALARSFDTGGWFARDAALMERVGRVLLEDASVAPKPARALFARDAFELAGEAVTQALQPALARVAAIMGTLKPVTMASEGLREWFEVFKVLQGGEVWQEHGAWVTRAKPNLGGGVRQRIEWASQVGAADIARRQADRERITDHMAGLLADRCVLVLPTVPGIAPPVNSPAKETEDLRARAMSLLSIAGLARLPQLSLPLATLDGCPVGLSLVAASGEDVMLLELGRRIAGANTDKQV